MKLAAGILLLSLAPVWGQIQKPAALTAPTVQPKVARLSGSMIGELEKTFDGRVSGIGNANEPLEILSDARGLQLDGYGLVFTSEVSLVRAPAITPFQKEIPKLVQERVHQLRVERLPILKAAMKEMLRNMAVAGKQLPATQQMVLAVRLWYGAWEDTTGMPRQILMHANRQDAETGIVETEDQ
ncbi:MAG: hypothetical protein JWP63_932 [Candidatus Solibacter sp.]|nr:hypothetical protein [Candidatus Solibacter sp.]